jgi:hypothetical protein
MVDYDETKGGAVAKLVQNGDGRFQSRIEHGTPESVGTDTRETAPSEF